MQLTDSLLRDSWILRPEFFLSSSILAILALWVGNTTTLHAQQTADSVQPESATAGVFSSLDPQVQAAFKSKNAGTPVSGQTWMVVAAS